MHHRTKQFMSVIHEGEEIEAVLVNWITLQAYIPTEMEGLYAIYSVRDEDGTYYTVNFLDYGGLD